MDMNNGLKASWTDSPIPTIAIEAAQFYTHLHKVVKKCCIDANLSDEAKDALINQLLLHIIQFQSCNNVIHLERHTKMAINIIRESGIDDTDAIILAWSPFLLVITAKFIMLKMVERTPIWRLVAHVEGTLYLTPE